MEHMHEKNEGNRYVWATLLNIIITLAEVIGGLLSGSLALLSDAVHNFTDTLSLIIAGVAQKISCKEQNERNTFGYRRAQIIAAFVNSIFLVVVTVILIFESLQGFMEPHPIKGGLMLIIAFIGLVANLGTALILHNHNEESLNQRAAYLHIMADTLSSVGVLLAGVLIYFFHINWIDPLVTLFVAIYMLKETWPVLKKTTQILMQANIDVPLDAIVAAVKQFPHVKGCHHFHTWQIDENNILLSFHVTLDDMQLSDAEELVNTIRRQIAAEFGVSHVTVQTEVDHVDRGLISDYDWDN
jgi:cobalt-zinc-cadmium efflux system protein